MSVETAPAMALDVFVAGQPVPQGSKRHVGNGRMVEMAKDLPAWREAIRWTAVNSWRHQPPLDGGVSCHLVFVMRRPLSTPKRFTPPAVKKPDADKLARGALDALTSAGVWRDDSQVVDLHVTKRLAEIGETPGCHIRVHRIVAPS